MTLNVAAQGINFDFGFGSKTVLSLTGLPYTFLSDQI
jgi:hypothetical protein